MDRVYWDANVFLAYINGDADRLPDIEGLLDDAKAGRLEILTSTLTQAEVAYGAEEQTTQTLSSDVEEAISSFWHPDSPIKLVDFYPQIAAGALGLMRTAVTRGWSLKPFDALHLSTAQRMKVDAFHTYDVAKLGRFADDVGFRIEVPLAPQKRLL